MGSPSPVHSRTQEPTPFTLLFSVETNHQDGVIKSLYLGSLARLTRRPPVLRYSRKISSLLVRE